MSTLLELLGKLLGLGGTNSPIAQVTGIINNAALLPVVLWCWANRNEIVEFKLSLGALALIALLALFYLEILRRSEPRNGENHG